MIRILLVCFAVVLSFSQAFAQTDQWKHFSRTKDIRSIAEEGEYLWLTSLNSGLICFHKETKEITFFHPANSGLHSYELTAVAVAPNGDKWVSTNDGVARFDGTSWTSFLRNSEQYPLNLYNRLAIDGDGRVYTAQNGLDQQLRRFENGSWTAFNTNNSPMVCDLASNIRADQSGDIWFTTCAGIMRIQGDDWQFFDSGLTSLTGGFIYGVASDNIGTVWLSTQSGLEKFDGQEFTLYDKSNPDFSYDQLGAISIDQQGAIWMANSAFRDGSCNPCLGGLIRFDGSDFEYFNASNSPVEEQHMYTVFVDTENRIWAGGEQGILYEYDGSNWTSYDLKNGDLAFQEVQNVVVGPQNEWLVGSFDFRHPVQDTAAIQRFVNGEVQTLARFKPQRNALAIDEECVLWYASQEGVSSINEQQLRDREGPVRNPQVTENFAFAPNKGGAGIWSLHIDTIILDQDGLPSWQRGLSRFDGSEWITLSNFRGELPCSQVRALDTDSEGNLWVLCDSRISRYDGQDWTNFSFLGVAGIDEPTLMRTLFVDQDDRVWISGVDAEFFVFDGEIWTWYTTQFDSLEFPGWNHLTQDRHGTIWAANNSDKLIEFDGEFFTEYNFKDVPIPSHSSIYSLAVDSLDNILIGSWAGLTVFNKEGIRWPREIKKPVPPAFALYPNPSRFEMTLAFTQDFAGPIQIQIFDMQGKLVMERDYGQQPAGFYSYILNTSILSRGVYVVHLTAAGIDRAERLVLVGP